MSPVAKTKKKHKFCCNFCGCPKSARIKVDKCQIKVTLSSLSPKLICAERMLMDGDVAIIRFNEKIVWLFPFRVLKGVGCDKIIGLL